MNGRDLVKINVSLDELRYLIGCGAALAQNVPEKSLPTYCGFNKAQIVEFSSRMRNELELLGEDL